MARPLPRLCSYRLPVFQAIRPITKPPIMPTSPKAGIKKSPARPVTVAMWATMLKPSILISFFPGLASSWLILLEPFSFCCLAFPSFSMGACFSDGLEPNNDSGADIPARIRNNIMGKVFSCIQNKRYNFLERNVGNGPTPPKSPEWELLFCNYDWETQFARAHAFYLRNI